MSTRLVPRNALTPEQLRAVALSPEEHRVILGPSGSGKTHILLHRARYLCDTFHVAEDRFHIFVLTSLCKDYLGSALQLLDLPSHCVTTLDRWCAEFYQGHIERTLPWDWEEETFYREGTGAWFNKVPDFAAIRRAVLNKLRGYSPKQFLFDFVLVDEGQDVDEEAFELLKTVAKHVTVCMDHKPSLSQAPVSYNSIAYSATFGYEHGQARRDAQGAWWFTVDDGAVTLLRAVDRTSLHLHGQIEPADAQRRFDFDDQHGNQHMYGQGSKERQLLARLGLQRGDVALSDVFRCCPYILRLAAQLLEDPEEATGGLTQAQIVQSEKETPLLYQAADFEDEQRRLIEILKVRLVKGEKIAILLPQKRQVYGCARRLREAGLEVETPEECDFATDLPKILPYCSAKGLTFETVLMPRLVLSRFAPWSESRIERWLFVGITRATKWVYISTIGNSRFSPIEKLTEAVSKGCLTVQLPRQSGIDRGGTDKASKATTEDDLTDLL